nr:MAG TPA: hypothetical protein [Microviridae sp.]
MLYFNMFVLPYILMFCKIVFGFTVWILLISLIKYLNRH